MVLLCFPGTKFDRSVILLEAISSRRRFYNAIIIAFLVFELWDETSNDLSVLDELQLNILQRP